MNLWVCFVDFIERMVSRYNYQYSLLFETFLCPFNRFAHFTDNCAVSIVTAVSDNIVFVVFLLAFLMK